MGEIEDPELDLEACAREPIHIPGSIQPHGVMLVADRTTLEISHAAGDVARRLGRTAWLGCSLGEVLGQEAAERLTQVTASGAAGGYAGRVTFAGGAMDMLAHVSGGNLVVELEPGEAGAPAAFLLAQQEAAGAAFERAAGVKALCERAAVEFRRLTGFDRVMIYRFLEDDAGAVMAEDVAEGMPSFLNHHFPVPISPPRRGRSTSATWCEPFRT